MPHTDLTDRLANAIAAHGVPGASLAVWHKGHYREAASGMANMRANIAATTDTLFQIGSITKLYTAVLILQLVAQGRFALDDPVVSILRDFALADADAAAQVTVRQLLCHSGGMDGDFFKPHGRGEDRIARYVADCRDLPQLHQPGALFSYCNSGYVILGRIIEQLTGQTWDKALKERLLRPLAARETKSLPEEAIRFRCAMGHMTMPETGKTDITPIAYLAQSNAPAGSTLMASARDVIRFARMILDNGTCEDGTQLLDDGTAALMQQVQIRVPPHYPMSAWGLGCKIFDWHGVHGIGHDGVTIGQCAFLRMVPKEDLAIVLLTNGGDANALYEDIIGSILSELAGVSLPKLPSAANHDPPELTPYLGTYEKLSARVHITAPDATLISRSEVNIDFMGGFRPMTLQLTAVDRSLWLADIPDSATPYPMQFLNFDVHGRPGYLHMGLRAYRRVA